jgi:hypothetical protein
MGQRLIISEEDRNRITKMYGLVNEEYVENTPLYIYDINNTNFKDTDIKKTIYIKSKPLQRYIDGKPMDDLEFTFDIDKNYRGLGVADAIFSCTQNYITMSPFKNTLKDNGILNPKQRNMMNQFCKKYKGPVEKGLGDNSSDTDVKIA